MPLWILCSHFGIFAFTKMHFHPHLRSIVKAIILKLSMQCLRAYIWYICEVNWMPASKRWWFSAYTYSIYTTHYALFYCYFIVYTRGHSKFFTDDKNALITWKIYKKTKKKIACFQHNSHWISHTLAAYVHFYLPNA